MKANRTLFYASMFMVTSLLMITGCGSQKEGEDTLTGGLGEGDTNGYQPNEIKSIEVKR